MPLTADQIAQKWANNLGAATTQIRTGVQAVTQSPTAAAANAVSLWQQKMALQSTAQKYVKGLNRTSLQDWQNAMINKGLARIGSGAQAAIPKFTKFMNAFLPFEMNIAQQVRQMPKVTIDDAVNRAATQIRGNATFPGY
jgi:hypothetical protein